MVWFRLYIRITNDLVKKEGSVITTGPFLFASKWLIYHYRVHVGPYEWGTK